MAVVRREPLAEQAAAALLDRIRAGEWHLGERLPGETTLAAQLSVGRSTVREAIRQLSGRGVLTSRQGAGVFVIALDVPEDWDAVLRRADIVSVIEARVAIESEAAALTAERRTPAELRTIRKALEVRGAASPTLERHVDSDMVFHRSIVSAAHNPILIELFDGFVPRLRQAMVDMLRLRPGPARDRDDHLDPVDHAAHVLLYDAIAARDSDAAARLSRAHLTSLKESLR